MILNLCAKTQFLALLGLGTLVLGSALSSTPRDLPVIVKDVCILGGGAAGTYAAIRLKDMNQSVVVIEQKDHLGGHVDTYSDPDTGMAVDFGVIGLIDIPVVTSFLSRLKIPVTKGNPFTTPGVQVYVDFRTGKTALPPAGNVVVGLAWWSAQLANASYLEIGWNLPDPVPTTLVESFGEFARSNHLDNQTVYTISLLSQGMGDWLPYPTVYLFKYYNLDVIRSETTGYIFPTSRNMSSLYASAQQELGDDILLDSVVTSTSRGSGHRPHRLRVSTPTGDVIVIAKKLIITAPPIPDNLQPLDPDDRELQLSSQWKYAYYYSALLKHTGLPDIDTAFLNLAPDRLYELPRHPCSYAFIQTRVKGLWSIQFGSPFYMSEAAVKRAMTADLLRLRNAGYNTTTPEFVAFTTHAPFLLSVDSEAIESGYYRSWNELQGSRNTFWAGAAFECQNSGSVWRFVESLLPSVVEGKE